VLETAVLAAPKLRSSQHSPLLSTGLYSKPLKSKNAGSPAHAPEEMSGAERLPSHKLCHPVPLNTSKQLMVVLYIVRPSAGLLGRFAFAILGGKKPLVVLLNSNSAEAWGVLVPMPTWAYVLLAPNKASVKKLKIVVFMTVI
jgi:hypothetical protein